MSIIKFASLKIPVNTGLIQQEVASLQQDNWHPHLNRYHYEGNWDVLSLRSPGGNNNTLADAMNNEGFADTELMHQCSAISKLVNELQCDILSVRLLNLRAGAVIKEHTDKELYFENGEARLHFPVFTNPEVEFFIDSIRVKMNEGDCWYINANLPHRLANKGSSDRIHLVIDCKVNAWLQDIFQNHFVQKDELSDSELILRDRNTIQQTITELRKQSHETSQELADKLEQQLHQAEADAVIDKILAFVRSVGIAVLEEALPNDTFLPGMTVENGSLLLDRHKLLYPGDLLHEAGHIAVVTAEKRKDLDSKLIAESKNRAAEEMMAIAWSYAACIHLHIDPHIVFHKDGYKNGSDNIIENFSQGRFFGTPMLQWCGMTIEPRHATDGKKVFPEMIKWLRD